MNNSNITNEQIIQSARRQRQSVNSRMDVETWHPHHRHGRGIAAAIAIAASFISFIVGYGVRANMSQSDIQPMAQLLATAFVPTCHSLTSSQWHRTSLCSTIPSYILRPSVTLCIRCALSLSM